MVSFLWYSVGCYCDFIVIRRRLMILCRSRYPYFFSNMSEKPGPITRCFAYLILTGSIQFYNALIVQNSLNNIIQNILEEAVLKLQKHSSRYLLFVWFDGFQLSNQFIYDLLINIQMSSYSHQNYASGESMRSLINLSRHFDHAKEHY